MRNVLAITSSPMAEGSVSNELVQHFVEQYVSAGNVAHVVRRDVGITPPPHLDASTIGAFYTPTEQADASTRERLAISDALVDELEAAEVIVIGAPMHNFGITSGLKSWVDHVARVGRTFTYTENGPKGLLDGQGKKVYVLTSRGGRYAKGTPTESLDLQTPYLKTVLGFIGLTDVTFISAEGVAGGRDGIDMAVSSINETIEELSEAA